MRIGKRDVGPGHPVFIVAELSANHHQSFDEAVELIRESKAAGADAVKLQTYTADTITLRSDRPQFRVGGGMLWDGRLLHDLYQEAFTPWEWQPKLKAVAEELGLECFSSPFDATAVDFLEGMGVPAHKVASFEVVDLPLLERIGRTKKPVIMSTGMATLAEIEDAVRALRAAGTTDLALLKCTSAYPAPAAEADLRTIPHLAAAFGVVAGLSDHTLGTAVPVVAVSLGACIIEKHLTRSRAVPGPDSAFSLEPHELKQLVDAVRTAEQALGSVRYGPSERERASLQYRRSLFAVEDIRAGEPFTERNVRSIRPAHGLPPKELPRVLGRRATRDLERGTPLGWDDVGAGR
jgi:N-acetylneuraminate synthase